MRKIRDNVARFMRREGVQLTAKIASSSLRRILFAFLNRPEIQVIEEREMLRHPKSHTASGDEGHSCLVTYSNEKGCKLVEALLVVRRAVKPQLA